MQLPGHRTRCFLALLVATYVKYGHDEPVGVEILGPVHGALFITYVVLA